MTFAVADDILFSESELLTKENAQIYGFGVNFFEISAVSQPVLAYFKANVAEKICAAAFP